MRNFEIILIVILSFFSIQVSAQKKNYQVTAIAFYNLENLFDPADDPNKNDEEFTPNGLNNYTEEVYRKKLYNLSTVLKQLGTDVTPDGPAIIGTAEIENGKVLEDLINEPLIKDRGYRYIWFEGPDNRGIDVAMLYNPKYFEIIGARTIVAKLSESSESTRDVLHVMGLLGNDSLHILVNHWPSRRGGESATAPKRAAVARINKAIVDSVLKVNPNAKVVVMGDLNDDPVDVSVANVLGAKPDMSSVKNDELFNPWTRFFKQGIGTLGYNDSWNLFDQIILSGTMLHSNDTGWHYYKAEVFNKEFLKEKFGRYKGYPHRSFSNNVWLDGYSDHFPTLVYLIK